MIKREEEQEKVSLQNGNPTQRACSCHCQCCCHYQDAFLSHDPFLIRRWIVVSSAALGIVVAFLGGFFWERDPIPGDPLGWGHLTKCSLFGLALYFCCVSVGDFLSHFALKLKSSSFSDEALLLKIEGVTGEELDHYFDTRRNIRMSSFLAASLVVVFSALSGAFDPIPAFCITYILSTLLGILAVRIFSKRRRPKLIRRDPSYDIPPWSRSPMSGYNYLLWQQGKLPYWW